MNKDVEALYEQLEKTRKDLFSKLEKHPAEKMNTQADPNSWSVVQVMNHLSDAEGGAVNYMTKKLSFNPKLKKAGLKSSLRYALLQTAFYTPIKFKVPEVVGQPSNEESYAQAKQRWEQVRADMKSFLGQLSDEQVNAELFKHPAAGKLNMSQAVKFMQTHFNRHQGQVDRILKAVA